MTLKMGRRERPRKRRNAPLQLETAIRRFAEMRGACADVPAPPFVRSLFPAARRMSQRAASLPRHDAPETEAAA